MKKFTIMLVFLIAGYAHAAVSTNQKHQLNNEMGGVAHQLQLGTLLEQAEMVNGDSTTTQATQGVSGHALKRIARIDYSPVSMGGTTIGTTALGVSLPGKAIITRSYIAIEEAFTDSGSGTVAFKCGTAGNILAAEDLTLHSANSVIEGVSSGTALTMKQIPGDCDVSATVAVASQTAGEAVIFLEYVIGE